MKNINEPVLFGEHKSFKNRLVLAPMTTKQSFFDGALTEEEIDYYANRSGGFGAVITGAANVLASGKGWHGELSVENDEMIPGLTKLSQAIKAKGAKAILQIFHAGRMTERAVLFGETPISASAIKPERAGYETPRELQGNEINEIIKAFGKATKRAIESGFDGIEIHGANTYLIQQFFSPHSNRRSDKWGGDIEKRYTFIAKLIDEVFSSVDEMKATNFIVGYRFSPEELETPGIRFDDTIYLVNQLVNTRLDYLHVSLKAYDQYPNSKGYQEKTTLQYLHELINGKKPLISVGSIQTRADIEHALAYSEAVAVGTQALIDPTWAEKIVEGRDDEIVQKDFSEAIHDVELTHPLKAFLLSR